MRPIAVALSVVVLGGCVSRSAGYRDVQGLVRDRGKAEVRWNAIEGTPPDVDELLAKPLDERAAVAVALLNHPDLQAGFEELGIAAGELQSALALPNPRVQTGVHFLKGRDPQFDIEVMLSLSQLFFMPLRQDAAEGELEAAKLEVAGKALDLVLAVRRSFLEHQAAAALLALQREDAAAARAAWETALQLQKAGNITDLEAATEEAAYEEARLDVAAAELALAVARERLGERLGLWGKEARWSIAEELADVPEAELGLTELETQALERNLDLRIAEQRHGAAAARADLATAEGWLPDLSGGVEVQREEEGWEIGPEIEIEVPLFYQGQGERAAAEAAMRQQTQRHAGLAIRIRAAARAAAARLRAARSRARFYPEVLLPVRQKVLEQTQLQYNAMSASVFELLRAKRMQIAAERAYVTALRDYWIARAEVEQLLAGRLIANGAMPSPGADASLDAADAH